MCNDYFNFLYWNLCIFLLIPLSVGDIKVFENNKKNLEGRMKGAGVIALNFQQLIKESMAWCCLSYSVFNFHYVES